MEKTREIWAAHMPSFACSLVARLEGYRGCAYQCSAGVWTIGFGHSAKCAVEPTVKEGMHCDQIEAMAWLVRDLMYFSQRLEQVVKVPVSVGEYVALLSFVFNCGVSAFAQSTMLKKLNARDYAGAAAEFDRWVFSGGKIVPGLQNRRKAEREVFEKL